MTRWRTVHNRARRPARFRAWVWRSSGTPLTLDKMRAVMRALKRADELHRLRMERLWDKLTVPPL